MLPNAKGSYQAQPMSCRVGKSKNGALEFAVEFQLYGFWDGTNWVQESSEITGYFYLVTKEGKINETTVAQVEDAFGWNRASGTAWLAVVENLRECQLSLDFEQRDNGKDQIRVKWLNPLDHDPVGGLKPSDPQEVKSLDAQFGNLFRATARKPVENKPAPAASPTPLNPLAIAKKEAWTKFQVLHNGKSKEEMANVWKSAMAEYFDGAPTETLGADHFNRFAADKFEKAKELVAAGDAPFGSEVQFQEDDIPF
jgi:hypothetical protein